MMRCNALPKFNIESGYDGASGSVTMFQENWVQQYMLNNTTRMQSAKSSMWPMPGEGPGFFDGGMAVGVGVEETGKGNSESSGDLRDK